MERPTIYNLAKDHYLQFCWQFKVTRLININWVVQKNKTNYNDGQTKISLYLKHLSLCFHKTNLLPKPTRQSIYHWIVTKLRNFKFRDRLLSKFKSPANFVNTERWVKLWVAKHRNAGLSPGVAEQLAGVLADGTEHGESVPHAANEHDKLHLNFELNFDSHHQEK